MTVVIACNKGYGGGWGEPHHLVWKPTLIPKLKQAFIDGKLSVDYHKIIAPSLKPLPYKKGVGWIGKGWVPHGHGFVRKKLFFCNHSNFYSCLFF